MPSSQETVNEQLAFNEEELSKNPDYQRLHAEQNGSCAICKSTEDLCLDRSIYTDKLRAILCLECKLMITGARESPELMQRLNRYRAGTLDD